MVTIIMIPRECGECEEDETRETAEEEGKATQEGEEKNKNDADTIADQ